MNILTTIRRSIAVILLLVFITGAAPKTFFHEVFADHHDVSYCNHPVKSAHHFHKQGLDCHFDHTVVTIPYVLQDQSFTFVYSGLYATASEGYLANPLRSLAIQKESRGPPVS